MKKKNPPKPSNSIQFEMDPYVSVTNYDPNGVGLQFENPEIVHKSYTFERFDQDIINSPVSHKIQRCNINIDITTKKEIKKLKKFLSNLEESILTNKKK